MSDFVMSKFASKDDMISAMRAALATCTAERPVEPTHWLPLPPAPGKEGS